MSDEESPPNFFRRAVETVGVGVAAYGSDGRYRYVNERYAALFGVTPDDLVGEALWDVVPAIEAERFDDYWASFDDHETRVAETVHEYDGERVPVETVTTCQPFDDERVHFGTVREITERRRRERELQRQNERLDSFAGVVSHDLRNPLNVARGYVEILQEDVDRDELELIDGALGRMETLVDDLLTLARGGETVAEPEPVAVGEVARTAWETVATGSADLQVDADRTVVADRSRLRQLFENLFRNAVEHGGESVTVRVVATENGFAVADDGPGVDDVESVEELASAGDATGLGLRIVRHVADAHGWTLSVGESAGGGLRIDVTTAQ